MVSHRGQMLTFWNLALAEEVFSRLRHGMEGGTKSFTEHLEELRRRIIYILIFFFVSVTASYFFSARLLSLLVIHDLTLHFFTPLEPFLARIYVSLFAGSILTLPFFLSHFFVFLWPALLKSEKGVLFYFVFFGMTAFCVGAYLGYRFLLPLAVKVLFSFGKGIAEETVGINNFLKFSIFLILGSGGIMEIPVITFCLARSGIVDAGMLLSKWRYAVIIILVFTAIITPTVDPFTLLLVSLPIMGLYLLSILFAKMGRSGK
ncbi:twin-arginine translocase subunit TatC [candidate division WOR-3 bacterium JGI_Cruoil_03_44_89]|uniref:Sec-independent protein translocase protein TatC n=1 Tax=candidate division WOR-3 bacterium JGI_Cruoil_03_44_89 TaxID=1973748 RepID=A0A235BN36_UNCW3|nr:MAG: twin-arginine translocase subunit TatC [candidate division WOR-3 bacterium JGI_Cruoil_03_44_89]